MNFIKKLFSRKVEEAAEVPPEFLQENAPDWLIDLKGQGLPHGNPFSIRTELFQVDRTGKAEILDLSLKQGEQPKSATTGLDRPELDKLLVILGFSFPNEIENVAWGVKDGLPVDISIYRREPWSMKTASCYLAGWLDTKKSKPPIVEIGQLLLNIKKRALPP